MIGIVGLAARAGAGLAVFLAVVPVNHLEIDVALPDIVRNVRKSDKMRVRAVVLALADHSRIIAKGFVGLHRQEFDVFLDESL